MMTCRSDDYNEGQPVGWSSLSREAMSNWKSLRANHKAQ